MVDYGLRNWSNCPPDQPCHNTYHFADVAIERDKYDRSYQGTNSHDVVAAIGALHTRSIRRPQPLAAMPFWTRTSTCIFSGTKFRPISATPQLRNCWPTPVPRCQARGQLSIGRPKLGIRHERVARQAFMGLSFRRIAPPPKVEWTVTYDDHTAYLFLADLTKRRQLSKAAHLAEVLNAIWP
jgi:hypothetical protein